MKKILSILMVAVMVLSIVSINVGAATELRFGDFEYEVENGEVSITDYYGDDVDLVIPSEINGYTVTSIAYQAFRYSDFTTVLIPNTVTTIGSEAFRGCDNLVSVVIPEGVTTIGTECFSFCDVLEEVVFPKTLTTLGYEAFYLSNNVKTVTFNGNLSSVNKNSFYGPENLTVYFNGNVDSIEDSAFYNVDSVTVYFRGKVGTIDEGAFDGCNVVIYSSLKVVKTWVDNANKSTSSEKPDSCKFINTSKQTKVSLSTTSYTYNGKSKKPKAVVTDSLGTKISTKYYKVKYDTNTKSVGKHKVVVTFSGNYSGSKTLYYTIYPTSKTSIKLTVKEKVKIGAKSDKKITYSSSKSSVAKVNSKGEITGKKTGTTTITVKSNGIKSKIKVTVRKPGLTISGDKSVYRNKSIKLKATTYPANKKVTWSVSNKKIAKISSSGKLTGLKRGTVTVTAKFKYNGKTYKDTFKVKVKVKTPKISVWISDDFEYVSSIWISVTNSGSKKLTVIPGGTVSNGVSSRRNLKLIEEKNNNIYNRDKIEIAAGKEAWVGFKFKESSKFLYDGDDGYFMFYFKYDGETYAATCYGDTYGMNKCRYITRVS